jgi:hypothetical protein
MAFIHDVLFYGCRKQRFFESSNAEQAMRFDHKIMTNTSIKNNCPCGPRANRPMKTLRTLMDDLTCEKNKKSPAIHQMSLNLKTYEKHLNPEPVENNPISETLKTKMSSTLG